MTGNARNETRLIPLNELASYRGLTSQRLPYGWKGSDEQPPRDRTTDPDNSHSRHVHVNKAIRPKGLKKSWRYFKGLLSMLRRPLVMHEYPIHLQLETTDACNLNCTMCSRDVLVEKPSLLQAGYWKGVIDELMPANINVSGIGEPFLHPEIYEIIRYAKSKGSAINCATNFTRLDGNHRKLVECGIDQLKVSIDATDKETFRLIRGEDSWDEIVANIREVNKWKEKLGASTPSIRFNFALQQFNHSQCVELIELAYELDVQGVYYQPLSYVDMEDRKLMLTGDMRKSELLETLGRAEVVAKRYGISTNLDRWLRDYDLLWNSMLPLEDFVPNSKSCYMPWVSSWLGADGWVRPCPVMPWTSDEGRMGHIGVESFAEIWNNEKYRELRRALRDGERPTRSCKTCSPQDLYTITSIKSKLLP